VTQSQWYCPEHGEFSVLNNYEYSSDYQASSEFSAMFMSCTDAQEVLGDRGPEKCDTTVPLDVVLPGVLIIYS
jgi:hypothetical protein